MEFVRRWMAQIKVQLGELSATAKWAIVMCLIVVVGGLFLVALYARSPEYTALFDQTVTGAERTRITAYLDRRGITWQEEGGAIMVPSGKKYQIETDLMNEQLLPTDTSSGFDALVERQSWWTTTEQNRQNLNIARQNVLGTQIGRFRGVNRATVVVSIPEPSGFGRAHVPPSASVNVVMDSGVAVNQKLVEAIASYVASSLAGMKKEDVTVVDANAGRSFTVKSGEDAMAGTYLEARQAQERLYEQKIMGLLGHIPRVTVAVNVEMDMERQTTEKTSYDRTTSVELLTNEQRKTTSMQDVSKSAEPGVRPNVGADITAGGGAGRTSTTEESESSFEPHPGMERTQVYKPSGLPMRVSAAVNIPRSYFVGLYMNGKPEGTAAPTDQDLSAIMTDQLDRIKRQIEPLLATKMAGVVVVDMYPDMGGMLAGGSATASMGGPVGALLQGGWLKEAGLAGLAVMSLGMMLMMMRKAARAPKLPTAEELAGLPPALHSDDEVMGEAEEIDAALEGMELDEGQVRARKLNEQVSEMVRANPAEAASLLGRWVRQEN